MIHLVSGNVQHITIWFVAVATIALVLIRPRGISEAWWSAAGACCLLLLGLVSPAQALAATRKGTDVYLFLIGMMIMAEIARREGLFDWIAGHSVRIARGSRKRLFVLVYGVGVGVTIFLSNDATAVVLTPAVQAAIKAAQAEPLPFLFACAFIANAASFVLPISNPANLVVYSYGMPPLGKWLAIFGVPSIVSIAVTFGILRMLASAMLNGPMSGRVDYRRLTRQGKTSLAGIAVLAVALMTASAVHVDLGAPAFGVGLLIAAIITWEDHRAAKDIARDVAWGVVPMVAGLFIVVEGLNNAGAQKLVVLALRQISAWSPMAAAMAAGFGVAGLSNVMNNLPSGLIAGSAVHAAGTIGTVHDTLLLGVDLGPNLSVSGSLATILWLIAVRREGQEVGFWQFLKWGILVMPVALGLSIISLVVMNN